MAEKVRILGIAGSLRSGSLNRAALRAAQQLVPGDAEIEIFDLEGIPPYNQDIEASKPARVTEMKAKVRAADAILFVTPEYNHSIPGVLKNAIDWGSRPYGDNSWDDKPVAMMGASPGIVGTSRAQNHLRQTFVFLNMHPVNVPEVLIGKAPERFDEQGNLTDQKTREIVAKLVKALVDWTRRIQGK